MFFDSKFEKSINELGLPTFSMAFSIVELTKIRDDAKGVFFGGKPEEAAARAFRDLIVLNQKIPVEQRLESGFEKIGLLKWWHFDGRVNVDLHLGIKDSIEKLLTTYVGKDYEDDYYAALSKMGIVIPITHDTLRTIAFSFLYGGKKFSLSPNDAALRLYTDVLIKDEKKYSACLTNEGAQALAQLAAKLLPSSQ